jgi:hypothetical protein
MQTTVIQAVGNCENSVEILAVKRLRQPGFNPPVALSTLTFRTVAIPATVVRNMDFTAFIALFYVTAKRCRPTIFKCIQYPFMIVQNIVPGIETFTVPPDNIRDFPLWFHAKNCKAYPAGFSLIWAIPEQYEDTGWSSVADCVQADFVSYINQPRLPEDASQNCGEGCEAIPVS